MENKDKLNCAVIVNSFIQSAEVMDRLRKESEIRMRRLGFDFRMEKKYKLNKILKSCEEIRKLFDDVFLYGEHPLEEALYNDVKGYDSFLDTAGKMSMMFILIMDRVRTEEQERQLFDYLKSFPEVDVTEEEIEKLRIR